MTSLQRKMQRRKFGKEEFDRRRGERPQPVEVHDTYYKALHPTRGWKRVANARIWARQVMARLLGVQS